MKRKMKGVLGIGLAFVLVASMLVFAIPVSAGPYDDLTPSPVANKWVQFGPTQGAPPPGFWFYDPNIYQVGPIAEAIDGDLLCAIEYWDSAKAIWVDDILMSSDGGRTWSASTAPNAYRNLDTDDGTAGAQAPYYVVDMVFSSLYEDVAYATDGYYVYKTIDGGNNWTFVNMNSLETAICGSCGPGTWIPDCAYPACYCSEVITSIDVGYDGNDDPIVFIGTTTSDATGYGTVLWIADESWPAVWTDMDLGCYEGGAWCVYAVGCVPNFATNTTAKIYVAISDETQTQIISSTGGTCDWTFVSELYWDCDGPPGDENEFGISHASRFAFSTSFESNSVMFLGVTDYDSWCWGDCDYEDPGIGLGGDVYRIIDTPSPADNIAIDLNVRGFTSGCLGKWPADIWSLDIKAGDALIAGATWCWDQDPTNVYYSNDGGWTWAESKKDPTGMGYTSVIWYDESALAATWYCNCALSMSCGTTVGEFWNQISLISMDIDENLDLAHAPGYLDGSSTMYVLTLDTDYCYFDEITNLLRWDGTYWERVYSSMSYNWVPGGDEGCCYGWYVNWPMDWVECSPDFNQTGCVYLANTDFEMYRSMDEGCSWTLLTYPCEPRPDISAWIVVDSETVLAAGCTGLIYKTTYHGAQPWQEFPVPSPPAPADTSCGVDFDLSPNIANDSSVLYGSAAGKVYLSQDLGETWAEIQTSMTHASFGKGNSYNTYVVFDPGYGTAGDPGETMVYAAGGNLIGRCAYDATPGAKNTWVYISDADGDCVACDLCLASGIAVAGDTALYVADAGTPDQGTPPIVSGTLAVSYNVGPDTDTCDLNIGGSYVAAIEAGYYPCNEPLTIVAYNLACVTDTTPTSVNGTIVVEGLTSGYMARITIANVPLAYDCTDCTTAGEAIEVISSDITITCPSSTYCPAGVWRTLNPMDPMPPDVPVPFVEWSFLSTGLNSTTVLRHPQADAFGVYPDDLWLTAGSNMLWVLDANSWVSVPPGDTCSNLIWMWDDNLATPVVGLSPASGAKLVTDTMVTLSWNVLDKATLYEIELYSYCPACPDEKEKVLDPVTGENFTSKDDCITIPDLTPGTKYYWRVRVACDSPVVSKWSAEYTFETALSAVPGLCSPECGSMDNILTPNFSWDAVAGATGYEVEVATDEDFTAIIASGSVPVNAWVTDITLDYSTTYYWRVRAIKNGIAGAWSVCIFTTKAEPAAPVTPTTQTVKVETTEITPTWIWVIIGIGAALVIAVIILIVMTRRPS